MIPLRPHGVFYGVSWILTSIFSTVGIVWLFLGGISCNNRIDIFCGVILAQIIFQPLWIFLYSRICACCFIKRFNDNRAKCLIKLYFVFYYFWWLIFGVPIIFYLPLIVFGISLVLSLFDKSPSFWTKFVNNFDIIIFDYANCEKLETINEKLQKYVVLFLVCLVAFCCIIISLDSIGLLIKEYKNIIQIREAHIRRHNRRIARQARQRAAGSGGAEYRPEYQPNVNINTINDNMDISISGLDAEMKEENIPIAGQRPHLQSIQPSQDEDVQLGQNSRASTRVSIDNNDGTNNNNNNNSHDGSSGDAFDIDNFSVSFLTYDANDGNQQHHQHHQHQHQNQQHFGNHLHANHQNQHHNNQHGHQRRHPVHPSIDEDTELTELNVPDIDESVGIARGGTMSDMDISTENIDTETETETVINKKGDSDSEGNALSSKNKEPTPPSSYHVYFDKSLSDFWGNVKNVTIRFWNILEKNEEICVICMDNFQTGEQLAQLICGHKFHKECIVEWLQEDPTCPFCRHNVTKS